jgi:hypothetical protein
VLAVASRDSDGDGDGDGDGELMIGDHARNFAGRRQRKPRRR